MSSTPAKVGVVMGSSSDWELMQHAALAASERIRDALPATAVPA